MDDKNKILVTKTTPTQLQFEDNWLTSSTCCRHRHYNTSQFCPSKVEDPVSLVAGHVISLLISRIKLLIAGI